MQRKGEREAEKDRVLQYLQQSGLSQAEGRKAGTPSRYFIWLAGAQATRAIVCCLPDSAFAGSWRRSGYVMISYNTLI